MAPNKRKKKPSGNPERGFTTTSTASKLKEIDVQPEELEALSIEPEVQEHDESRGSKPTDSTSKVLQISQLSGEDLEKHLEESELQLLVEKFNDRSKKDASRHSIRLQTERRLLRGQAEKLNTTLWMPPPIIQLIEALESDAGLELQPVKPRSNDSNIGGSFDDLSIKIWTLGRSLTELGFMPERIKECLTWLISSRQTIERGMTIPSRESLWGFEECLEWLARRCSKEELPDYDTHRTEALQYSLEDIKLPDDSEFVARPNTRMGAKAGARLIGASHDLEGIAVESQDEKNGVKQDPPDVPDDEDLLPHELLGRYVDLHRRLYHHRPDLTDIQPPQRRGNKSKANTDQPTEPADPWSRKILTRIRRLRSDILFDRDEADAEWQKIRTQLVQEDAMKRRLELRAQAKASSDSTADTPAASRESIPALPHSVTVAAPDMVDGTDKVGDAAEDSLSGIGDLFSSLPEPVASSGAIKASISTTEDGSSITIRDFGKWTGVSPRRVFEEACKARDPFARIHYRSISSTSLAVRHSIIVHWSKVQELPLSCPVVGFRSIANEQHIKGEMIDIAAPDSAQSESYISVVVMFLIFAATLKEEKTYLRLPSMWRDLWMELRDARKVQEGLDDQEELRGIRSMIESTVEIQEQGMAEVRFREREDAVAKQPVSTASTDLALPDGETAKSRWAAKSSTTSFQTMLQSRRKLPIWAFKDELLNAIESNPITIICGETGCGKSTQIPSFILENEMSNGRPCRVYCTEPRRISAISLARRVSEELGENKRDVGTNRSLVGYSIRLESAFSSATACIYATTGIVMRMLERTDDLRGITHLVLDEVHERTIDSDFLLIVLKKLMHRRPDLKVVLMSATLQADQFSQYLGGAPVFNIPGRTFPVEVRYLEDAIEVSGYGALENTSSDREDVPDDDEEDSKTLVATEAEKLRHYSSSTRNALAKYNEFRINYDLIVMLLSTIATDPGLIEYSQAILVFLPGMAEIRRVNDMLLSSRTFGMGWYVFPLHSTIAMEDQEQAFLAPPPGIRKIVLATNIAETGITIPDVTCVVDTGKHKEMRFDEKRQLSRLIESFISRANAKQRRGRAGRVQHGLCFHLFTQARHDNAILERQIPEMRRLSLQELALRVTMLKIGDIEQTLGEALDPPSAKNVRHAINSLIDVKALTINEELTPLGRQLSKLPLDVMLGKLILLGSIFKCLDSCLTIAAILSSKSPFSAPLNARAQVDAARLSFKRGNSDLLTDFNAYNSWRRICTTNAWSEHQFCRKSFLNPATLSSIEELKAQLMQNLVEAGFVSLDSEAEARLRRGRGHARERYFVEIPEAYDCHKDNNIVIGSVIAWSFFPKILSRTGNGWKNISNTQFVSLHPSSVNKGVQPATPYLSFYHLMRTTKFLNAHETNSCEDFALAILCGEVEFKMYSGVVIIDGNRLRFAVQDWRSMIAIKKLCLRLREIMMHSFRSPGKPLSPRQEAWFEIWQKIFTQDHLLKAKN